MVVHRAPFGPAGRVIAWLFAGLCIAAGSAGLVLGILRHNLPLSVAATGILGLGILYAGAAWRGRPWPFR